MSQWQICKNEPYRREFKKLVLATLLYVAYSLFALEIYKYTGKFSASEFFDFFFWEGLARVLLGAGLWGIYFRFFMSKIGKITSEEVSKPVNELIEKKPDKVEILFQLEYIIIYKEVLEEGHLRFSWRRPKYILTASNSSIPQTLYCFRNTTGLKTNLDEKFWQKENPVFFVGERSGDREDSNVIPGTLYFYMLCWEGENKPFAGFSWKAPGSVEKSNEEDPTILAYKKKISALKSIDQIKKEERLEIAGIDRKVEEKILSEESGNYLKNDIKELTNDFIEGMLSAEL